MPAADISQVQVTFGNGIKREEYGPVKKADVTITAVVGQGQDGVAALSYISKIAQDKVRELLSLSGQVSPPAAAEEAPPAEHTPEPPATAPASEPPGEPVAEPPRRTRRTKAQIEADNAAAAAAQSPPAPQEPATSDDDEWAAAAPEATPIPDTELNHTCSVTAERLGAEGKVKVKATIARFAPEGDQWNPEKGGRKFTVNDIPQVQRAQFIAALKALT